MEAQLESLKHSQLPNMQQLQPQAFSPWSGAQSNAIVNPVMPPQALFPKPDSSNSSSETIQAMKLMLASQHMGFMTGFLNSFWLEMYALFNKQFLVL